VRVGAARGRGRKVEVDLPKLGRWLRAHRADPAPSVLVGHLAHRLPVRDAIVLRCHPVELLARLRGARRGVRRERTENVLAEATDVVLLEALSLGRRLWEIDTTGRTVEDVAREVDRLLRGRWRSRYGVVNWLADPVVTDYLLPALR
jgi:broad-specificity NMP kinase